LETSYRHPGRRWHIAAAKVHRRFAFIAAQRLGGPRSVGAVGQTFGNGRQPHKQTKAVFNATFYFMDRRELFLAVLLSVSHHSLFGMLCSVNYMAPCGVSMVRGLFVMSGVVMFGGFPVVAGGMRQMF
jgi:hypothetical protein